MTCLKAIEDHLQTFRNQLCHQALDCHRHNACKEMHCRKKTGVIPLGRKISYAFGGVPYQITAVAMGISMQIFLLDVVQMDAFYGSMILFVSRAWDAVTDPLVGYLVSRSNWTPIGKLMPWVVLSMPFAVLSYVLLWFMPQGSMSQAFSVPWFLVTACLFETLMSCFHVPYLSMNMALGGDQTARDSATAYRMTVEVLAMLVGSVIQGQVIVLYNSEKEGTCQQLDQTQLTLPDAAPSNGASLQGTRKAFLTSALVIGALFFLCGLVLFLGVQEQRDPLCSDEKMRVPYFTSLKLLACHAPFQRLVLGFLFCTVAFQMSLGNFALFCSHAARLGAHFQHILLVLLVSALIAVPIWQAVLVRIGKNNTVLIGLLPFILAVAVISCVPSNLPVFMIMCFLMGLSLATMFLLPWSMLPDAIDDFAIKNPLCKDMEPMFFSCYAFCNKLGAGLPVGISTIILHFVGYKGDACHHSDDVVTALTVMFSPVPIILVLIGMAIFRFYPINKKQVSQLQKPLNTEQSETTPSTDQQETAGVEMRVAQPQSMTSDELGFLPRCPDRMSPKCSNESQSPFAVDSRCVGLSDNVNAKYFKQVSSSSSQRSKSTRSVNKPGSFSEPPRVKSKVTWV